MTAPEQHPTWCHRPDCRAYAPAVEGWTPEPYHRGAPTTIEVTRGEQLVVWLSQPAGLPELTSVEIVAWEPASGPAWAAEHVFAHMNIPIDPADLLARAINGLIRTATHSGGSR